MLPIYTIYLNFLLDGNGPEIQILDMLLLHWSMACSGALLHIIQNN
jgi:hypothetical protein